MGKVLITTRDFFENTTTYYILCAFGSPPPLSIILSSLSRIMIKVSLPQLMCGSIPSPDRHMGHMDQDGKKVDEMSLFFKVRS